MNKSWNADKNIEFLEEYEKQSCLWNVHSPLYKNRDARDDAYEKLGRAMLIGSEEAKAKIRSLRSSYIFELTKITKSKKFASTDDDIYTPKVPWFATAHRILFNVVQLRDFQPGELDIEDIETAHNSTVVSTDESSVISSKRLKLSDSTTTSTNLLKPIISQVPAYETTASVNQPKPVTSQVPVYEIASPGIETAPCDNTPSVQTTTDKSTSDKAVVELRISAKSSDLSEANEFDIFGANVACQLKKLPELVALESMAHMQTYLMQQRIKCLKETASLSLNTPTENNQPTPTAGLPVQNHNESSNVIDPNVRIKYEGIEIV